MSIKSVAWLLAFGLSAVTRAQFAVPANLTERTDDFDQMYLAAPSPAYKDIYYLKDLTSDQLPGIDYDKYSNSGPTGSIVAIHPGSTNVNFTKKILLISCDPEEGWQGDSMAATVQKAISNDSLATAICFYTKKNGQFCKLNVKPIPKYNYFFSLWDPLTSISLLGNILTKYNQSNSTVGEIISAQAYINQQSSGFGGSSNRSTAVAMIILYSITGVITSLFILIIILGAVRAHRNPERYRMAVGWRRPTNRARGIARAILDTLPVVKYDDGKTKPQSDTPDVELAESSAAAATRSSEPKNETVINNAEVSSKDNDDTTRQAPKDDEKASQQQPLEQSAGVQDHEIPAVEPSGIGCSICTEDFENGQDIRVLPCEHKFHPACVDPWLLNVSGTCPLCRVDLRPEGSRDAEESQDQLPPPFDPDDPNALRGVRGLSRRRILMQAVRQEQNARARLSGVQMFPTPRPRGMSEARRRTNTLNRLRAERVTLREIVRNERDPNHASYAGAQPSVAAQRRAAILAALEQLPENIEEHDGSRWSRLRIRVPRRNQTPRPETDAS